MGEGTVRVDGNPSPEQLEREVARARGNLDRIVDELDRRRRELLDWRLQLRRHAGFLVGFVVVTAGLTALAVWRRHHQDRPVGRIRRWREALARAIANPDKVARPAPSIGARAAGSAASGVAGALAMGLARRAIQH